MGSILSILATSLTCTCIHILDQVSAVHNCLGEDNSRLHAGARCGCATVLASWGIASSIVNVRTLARKGHPSDAVYLHWMGVKLEVGTADH